MPGGALALFILWLTYLMGMPDSPEFPASSHLLFTYGTLMLTTGIPAVDDAMRSAGVSLGRAYAHGRLFDLGEYPGAVAASVAQPADEDAPKVWGHLLRLTDPAALFAVLDSYEGYDPGDIQASEFVRAETEIRFSGTGATARAQVYWYNFATESREAILPGDYLAHWSAKGKPQARRLV